MKKILSKYISYLMISVFAWIANASAGDVQYKIETFNDASSNLQIESIPESKFSLTSGEIRQSYQKGNLWIRVTIEKNKPDLILYFQNPAIDEIAVFSRDESKLGSWRSSTIPFKELLHGHALNTVIGNNLTQPIEFYLQIKSLSPKQFNVMVLSEFEAQKKEFTKYAILSSQVTAAVILMVWVSLQNWLARSKIFITVMISASLFVLSRLNYFGFFLDDIHPNSSRYLNLNMILFTSLISGGTLMVKESFGRLFTKQQHHYFLALFGCSLIPSFGLLIDIPRSYIVMSSLGVNFLMVATLFNFLISIFIAQKNLVWHYKFQLIILITYSLMSTIPGLYFIAPQLFPFNLGIPAYRDFFYPVLAFLIMALMLSEQREKEMDTIFNMAVTKANADLMVEKNKNQHVFLGMLLHEIKTPLSVIKFGAAALTKTEPKTQLWTSRVDSAADAINHILNQCLLADKFEFGLSGYAEEQIDIHNEISVLIERLRYLNPTYLERIEWQFSDELSTNTVALVDPVFFRSILENLITNALKYSETNSKVFLFVVNNISAADDKIEFQIKNKIGKVGPPHIDKIFTRYYRAEEAQGYSGTGLGLWLANQQATEMGSSIHCSFDEFWTTFSFQVPKFNGLI
jgi:signal transduction histidine kinase